MLGQYQKEGWVWWGYFSNFEHLQILELMISKLIYGSQIICFVRIALKFGFFSYLFKCWYSGWGKRLEKRLITTKFKMCTTSYKWYKAHPCYTHTYSMQNYFRWWSECFLEQFPSMPYIYCHMDRKMTSKWIGLRTINYTNVIWHAFYYATHLNHKALKW